MISTPLAQTWQNGDATKGRKKPFATPSVKLEVRKMPRFFYKPHNFSSLILLHNQNSVQKKSDFVFWVQLPSSVWSEGAVIS